MEGSNEFSEIFEVMVMDHSARPRNFLKLESPTFEAEGVNPLTGDQITIQFGIELDQIEQVGFSGKGSALATASASVLTEKVTQLSVQAASDLISDTLRWINDEPDEIPANLADDEYLVLLEIRHFPHRRGCASLPWRTALSALAKHR